MSTDEVLGELVVMEALLQPHVRAGESTLSALRRILGQQLRGMRQPLLDERRSITHHFMITARGAGGELEEHDGYLTVGLYPDGRPGEIFIAHGRAESETWRGLLDDFAIAVSLALQYGAPLRVICAKYVGSRYEPAGFTSNPKIPRCTSPTDYISRWLLQRFEPETPSEGGEHEAG